MFFRSEQHHYLLKSLGRQFENHFLVCWFHSFPPSPAHSHIQHEHYLPAYFDYIQLTPDTLINKIFDVLYSFDRRLGETLRMSPSHYIVIENIAHDKTEDWILYDLKPPTYLEPFRDLLPARVQMSGVTDLLPKDRKVILSVEERDKLLARFRRDLDFLARLDAVDYSVLLVLLPDGTARWALIDIFWSLREPRAKLTKYASDTGEIVGRSICEWAADESDSGPARSNRDCRCRGVR
jgi:hypothetical protein